jgi:hypothetical protein
MRTVCSSIARTSAMLSMKPAKPQGSVRAQLELPSRRLDQPPRHGQLRHQIQIGIVLDQMLHSEGREGACENTDKHGGKLVSVVGPGGYPLRHPGAVRSTSSRGGFSTAAMARGTHSLPLLMAEFTRSMRRDDRSGRRVGAAAPWTKWSRPASGTATSSQPRRTHASPIRWIRGARSVVSTRRCGLMPAGRSRLCPWSGRRGASRRGLSAVPCLRPRRGALHSDNNARDGGDVLDQLGLAQDLTDTGMARPQAEGVPRRPCARPGPPRRTRQRPPDLHPSVPSASPLNPPLSPGQVRRLCSAGVGRRSEHRSSSTRHPRTGRGGRAALSPRRSAPTEGRHG